MHNSKEVGELGEQIAAQFLRCKGYAIVARNFWTRLGEIDIIASTDAMLLFVEVKTRRSDEFGEPLESVNKEKFKKWMRACELYLLSHPAGEKLMRLDVISVVLTAATHRARVRHIENVTHYFV